MVNKKLPEFLNKLNGSLLIDAVSLLFVKATFIGLRWVVVLLGASLLDSTYFGAIALAMTIAELTRYIADWGSDTWSLRQFSSPDAAVSVSTLRWMFKLRSFGGVIAFVFALGLIKLITPLQSTYEEALIAVTAATSLWLNLGVNWMQARAALRQITPLFFSSAVLSTVLISIEYYLSYSFASILSTMVAIEAGLAVALMVLTFKRADVEIVASKSTATVAVFWRQWLYQSSPVAVAVLISLAYGKFDQFFVSRAESPLDLSAYMLAQKIVEPLLLFFVAITSTLYTRASSHAYIYGVGRPHSVYAMQSIRKMTAVAVICAGLFYLIVTVAAPSLLAKYPETASLLVVGVFAVIFRIINQCLTAFIQATGSFSVMLKLNMFFLPLFVVAIFVLGTHYGALGAAYGVLLGEAVSSASQFVALKMLHTKLGLK